MSAMYPRSASPFMLSLSEHEAVQQGWCLGANRSVSQEVGLVNLSEAKSG